MGKYWLYLETYAFIFKGIQSYLIYNSFSGHLFEAQRNRAIDKIIQGILKPHNMYCLEIHENDLGQPETELFVKNLRETYTGDVIPQAISNTKPAILYPKLNLQHDVNRLKVDLYRSIGEDIMTYLREITLYVNSGCLLQCRFCKVAYKQSVACTRAVLNYELSIENIQNLMQNIEGSSVFKINISGGDIFQYAQLKELVVILGKFQCNITFNCHFENILTSKDKLSHIASKNSSLKVIVFSDFVEIKLLDAIQLIRSNAIPFELNFFLSSGEDYCMVDNFIVKNEIDNYLLTPVYTKYNVKFFENNIFLNKDDILAEPLSSKQIFSHMVLNTNDFGRLIIMSNGDVYANVNMLKLGNIKVDSINQMIYSEMYDGNSWLRIRNQQPCNTCLYKYLCPSPSNYELTIGKPNLCHMED